MLLPPVVCMLVHAITRPAHLTYINRYRSATEHKPEAAAAIEGHIKHLLH